MSSLKDVAKDIVPYPAMVMAIRQGHRDQIALSLTTILARGRELGASDQLLKGVILMLRSEDVLLIDDVEAQALIDKFELKGA